MNLTNLPPFIIKNYPTQLNLLHGFFIGIGLKHAVEKKNYWHIPFTLLIPAPYVGYQLFNIFKK